MDALPGHLAGLRALTRLAYVRRGLRNLGLRGNSHQSVLHLWARRLPVGMFDGHRSIMPAPDHLVFHGLTKRMMIGLFDILSKDESELVGTSFRDALARSHLPSTRIYNPSTEAVISVGISEWAATLTVAAVVFRRALPSSTVHQEQDSVISPLQAALQVLDSYTELVNAIYYYPRSDIDGVAACRGRPTISSLKLLGDKFFRLVCAACLRGDTAAFGRAVDVPNLHRLREVLDHVIPALHHVRHAQELLFENAHQPLKRAVVTGNGWDDAGRALERARQCELASRLRLKPAYFGIPPGWLLHAGVQAALGETHPLWSPSSGSWSCWGAALATDQVPLSGRRLISMRYASSFEVRWWRGATKGGGGGGLVRVGDAVGALVSSSSESVAVNVARGTAAASHQCHVSYYSLVAVFNTPGGDASALVHPFIKDAGSEDWRINHRSFLYLPLDDAVRRALVLHSCHGSCHSLRSGVGHADTNLWRVLGRDAGYPSRCG